ncbi:hypothetical protein cyc_01137 [Cyclospora cayetanensis]|uniref:Uncharacterized protein n=1 Tax=Cyclospora cayetanensis TaxID=88456 RepID=A0A1D3D9Y5_9EIME|nr:hypothetical protein cyc_01137 [Cyclospora cayetanensis]
MKGPPGMPRAPALPEGDKQRSPHRVSLERLFGSPALLYPLGRFLSPRDLVHLCSCCRWLHQQQRQPGGLLQETLEEALRRHLPSLADRRFLLADATDAHFASRHASLPRSSTTSTDGAGEAAAEPACSSAAAAAERKRIRLDVSLCRCPHCLPTAALPDISPPPQEIGIYCGDADLVLRLPDLTLQQFAAFFLRLRHIWRRMASCSYRPAETLTRATARVPDAPGASVHPLETAAADTVAASTAAETYSTAASANRCLLLASETVGHSTAATPKAAAPPVTAVCLGAMTWDYNAAFDWLTISRGGSWCFIVRRQENSVFILQLAFAQCADAALAAAARNSANAATIDTVGAPTPAAEVASAGRAPAGTAMQEQQLLTSYGISPGGGGLLASVGGSCSALPLGERAYVSLRLTRLLSQSSVERQERLAQQQVQRMVLESDYEERLWVRAQPQLCEEAGRIILPFGDVGKPHRLLGWNPVRPGTLLCPSLRCLHSLTVAAIPVHTHGGSNSCCRKLVKEILVVGYDSRLCFMRPEDLVALPVAVSPPAWAQQGELLVEVAMAKTAEMAAAARAPGAVETAKTTTHSQISLEKRTRALSLRDVCGPSIRLAAAESAPANQWLCYGLEGSLTIRCVPLHAWPRTGRPRVSWLQRMWGRRNPKLRLNLAAFHAVSQTREGLCGAGVSCVDCREVSLATCRRLFRLHASQQPQQSPRKEPQQPKPEHKATDADALHGEPPVLLIAVSLSLGSLLFGVLAPAGTLPALQQQQPPTLPMSLRKRPSRGFTTAQDTVNVHSGRGMRWQFTLLWLREAPERDALRSWERLQLLVASGTLLYNSDQGAGLYGLETGEQLLGSSTGFHALALIAAAARLVIVVAVRAVAGPSRMAAAAAAFAHFLIRRGDKNHGSNSLACALSPGTALSTASKSFSCRDGGSLSAASPATMQGSRLMIEPSSEWRAAIYHSKFRMHDRMVMLRRFCGHGVLNSTSGKRQHCLRCLQLSSSGEDHRLERSRGISSVSASSTATNIPDGYTGCGNSRCPSVASASWRFS